MKCLNIAIVAIFFLLYQGTLFSLHLSLQKQSSQAIYRDFDYHGIGLVLHTIQLSNIHSLQWLLDTLDSKTLDFQTIYNQRCIRHVSLMRARQILGLFKKNPDRRMLQWRLAGPECISRELIKLLEAEGMWPPENLPIFTRQLPFGQFSLAQQKALLKTAIPNKHLWISFEWVSELDCGDECTLERPAASIFNPTFFSHAKLSCAALGFEMLASIIDQVLFIHSNMRTALEIQPEWSMLSCLHSLLKIKLGLLAVSPSDRESLAEYTRDRQKLLKRALVRESPTPLAAALLSIINETPTFFEHLSSANLLNANFLGFNSQATSTGLLYIMDIFNLALQWNSPKESLMFELTKFLQNLDFSLVTPTTLLELLTSVQRYGGEEVLSSLMPLLDQAWNQPNIVDAFIDSPLFPKQLFRLDVRLGRLRVEMCIIHQYSKVKSETVWNEISNWIYTHSWTIFDEGEFIFGKENLRIRLDQPPIPPQTKDLDALFIIFKMALIMRRAAPISLDKEYFIQSKHSNPLVEKAWKDFVSSLGLDGISKDLIYSVLYNPMQYND